jgi:preprotein translocase subunit SecE
MPENASKRTDDLKSPIHKSRNEMQALSVRDEVRLVEWPQRRSPRVLQEYSHE